MTDIPPDQDILNRIAAILGAIAPQAAQAVVFRGKLYDDLRQGQPVWVDDAGSEHRFTRADKLPISAISDVLDLAEEMQATPPFQNSPFTQFEARLTRAPSIDFETADIARDDSWTGLYMRPLSSLSLDEALALNIPQDEWQSRQPG